MAPVTITRAGGGQIDTELLQEKGFGVYCWYTGKTAVTLTDANGTPVATTDPAGTTPASPISTYLGETGYLLMRNQQVVWSTASPSTGSWQYSPTKYWPLDPDDMLTLRAYAPYTGYMVTDDKGMPQLPVVVSAQDYHNDTQHDPLWGTGKLVNPTTGEYYYPGTDPAGVERAYSQRYGHLYNNITYEMSGDNRQASTLPADQRNGIIDWYFHHGMASLMFTIAITNPDCNSVTITRIEISPLYEGALLSLDSPTAASTEKPVWTDGYGNMTVTLNEGTPATEAGDLAPIPTPDPEPVGFSPYPFTIDTREGTTTAPLPLLSDGLLIIPRNLSSTGMTISVTYYVDGDASDAMVATATVRQDFKGNTAYTMGLQLEPETKGLEISLVQSAFTQWKDGGTGTHTTYNW